MVTTDQLSETGDSRTQAISLQAHSSGPNYIVSRIAGENTVAFNLLNNQVASASRPRVALEAYSTVPVNIEDASTLSFNIIASDVPTNNVDVNVLISESGGNFLTSSTVPPVRLDKGADDDMTLFTVPIADNDTGTVNGDSTITVSLVDGEGYTLASPDNHKTTATVTDQTIPRVSIITVPEYAVEGESFTFTISATPAPTGPDSYIVSYTVGNGVVDGNTYAYYKDHTPAGGTLTTSTSGTVTINTTTPSHQITVNTNTDLASTESDGQIDIQITGGGTEYKPASNTATNVTIQDEDLIPKVSIDLTSAATMEEGETAIFELTTKTPNTTSDIMVNFNVVQSSGGGDFIGSRYTNPDPVPLLALGNKGTLMIETVADTEVESNETITVTVQAATAESNGKINYLVADSNISDFVTVQDNDIAGANIASITISGPERIYEGDEAEYIFTTDTATTGDDVINVNYRITEFGAFLETFDSTDPIQFEANETTQKVTLLTTADNVDEGDGWVRVQVLAYTSGGTGLQYSVGAAAIQTTTLLDDDDDTLPNVTIAAVSDSIIEGDATHANFTISSTGGTSTAARVELMIQQEGDFINSTVVNDNSRFPVDDISVPRDSNATFQVELFNDADEETNGSVTVSIIRDTSDNPVYSLGATTSARTTIIDNDAGEVKITIADPVAVNEGNLGDNTTLDFVVTLSKAALNDITVDYTLGKSGDSANITEDYIDATMRETAPDVFVPAAGKLVFKKGDTSKTITVDVVEDDVYESAGVAETFTITLSNATQGADIMDTEATGTINNDDVEQQFPDVTIEDITVSEYAGEVGITATLSKVHSQPVEIAFNYLSTNSTATIGTDFRFMNERIEIPAGRTVGTKTFSVINDNDNPQVNEIFNVHVTLSNARFGGSGTTKIITVTITELPDITISTDFTEVADSDYFEYTVDINPATHSNPVMVNLMADSSFPLTLTSESNSSSIMIPANKSSATGRIEFTDTYASGVTARDFVLKIAAANSNEYTANPIKDEISVDIADGRTLPVVSNSTTASSVIEGGMFNVEVVIAPAQTKDIDLNFELSTGAESPYVATLAGNPNQLTIPANDPTESWPVTIAENNQRDNHGEVSFKILPGVGYKINPLQFATTTQIVDNDITDTIEFTKFTISEDGVTPTGQEIKLADTGRSGQDIVVNYEILTGRSTATRHTAETDGDYMVNALMGTFTFNQTTSTDRIVITGRSDTSYEGNETIIVRFTSTNGVFLNDQGEKVASIDVTYIIDDSIADPVFTVSNLEFPVSTLSIQDSPPTADTISFDFATDVNAAVDITVTAVVAPETTATATTDYSLSTPSVTLASGTGNRSGSIVVTIPTTAVFSGAEVIVLNMTATNAIFSNNTNQQTVTITINDYPIVSMHELPSSVTQGHSFGFELRTSPKPIDSELAVNLEFNDGSNGIITAITGATEDTTYTDGYAGEVTIPIEGTLQVMVDTQNPETPSGDQDVMVTLAAGSNYNVSETASENSRTINLKDNEIASEMRPRLSIAADSTALVRADLNENAEFIITASHQTTDTIMVSVEVKEPGDFVTDGVLTPAPTLSTASKTTTIRVPTSDPRTGTNDPNSVVTVTLIDGDNYTISTEAGEHTATRTVTDDPPVVSFDGGVPEWLTQGNPLKFTLKIEPPQSTPTRVSLTINNGANPFLGAVTPAGQYNNGMLIIPPSGSQAFEIASSNQSVGRTNVSIEIRPENNATYTIASDSTGPQTISLGNHLSPTPTDPRFRFTDQIAGPIYVPHAGATVTFKIEKTALSESRTLRVMLSSADGNFITNPIQSMTLPPGIAEVFDFPVVLTDNDLNNRTGATTITAQLLDGANYTVAPITSNNNTRTVTVTDEPPVPEVSISTDYTGVAPGKKVPFTLELSEEPVSSLSINLLATDSDDSNTALSIGPIAVTVGQTLVSSEFTAPSGTAADLGTLTISVATGDDYVVATGDDGRILVRFVTQTTVPELSIAGPTSSEIEGGENLIFTITANNSTNVDLAIPVEIADHRSQNNANFVDEATYYVRLESGTTSATLPVSTNPDTTDEDDGVVSATIQADSGTVGYTIKANAGTAYADVWDDDGATPPILSVTAMEESIREGTMANFTVTRTGGDMTNRLAFRYRIIPTEIGAPDSSPLVVRFDANNNTFPIRVRTVDIGNVLTLNANIAVKIDSPRDYPTAEYRVNEDMQIARVQVTDTSQPIYISKVFDNVIPGEKFTFKVDTIPAAPTDLTINVSARDAQNNSLTVSEVKILRGKTSAIGEVTTLDGVATTLDKVTVTVNASGSLYAVPPNPFIEVPFMESARIPELSLVGPTAPVREGDPIMFTINANESTDADLAIEVGISNVVDANRGNFVENSNRLVRLPASLETVTFEVDTIHDNVDEADGVVKVDLVANNTIYRINPDAVNALTDVLDIDGAAPVLVTATVLSANTSIVEGNDASFRIIRNVTSGQSINIGYAITATTPDIYNGAETGIATIRSGEGHVDVPISTREVLTTDLPNDAGISIRVQSAKEYPSAAYRVGTPASAKVLVRDKPPVIEVASKATGFAENDSGGAIFTISATGINSGKTISVKYTVTQESGSYIDVATRYKDPLTRSVVLTDSDGDGIYTGDLPAVVLHNDLLPETTGEIRVTLNADPEENDTYTLGIQNTATAEIYDDERPVIVVESVGDVTEGTDANATFNFIAKASPNDRIWVNYTLLKTAGYSRFFNESANLSEGARNTRMQLDFRNNKKIHTYNIALIADPFFRPGITITLTLKDDNPVGSNYYLSDDDNEKAASIAISDDAEPTTLSVIEAPTSVLAGESFTFKVKVTPELGSNEDLTFAININDAIQGTTYLNRSDPGTISPRRIVQATHGSEFPFTVFTDRNGDGGTNRHGEIQIQFRQYSSYFSLSILGYTNFGANY